MTNLYYILLAAFMALPTAALSMEGDPRGAGFASSGEGLNLSRDAIRCVPGWMLDASEDSNDGALASSGEGLNLSQNAFRYVPADVLDPIDEAMPASPVVTEPIATKPALTQPATWPASKAAPQMTSCDAIKLHKDIRDFKGTAKQLILFCKAIPIANQLGLLRNHYFFAAVIKHGKRGKEFFPMCKGAFKEAVTNKQENAIVFNNYMEAAATAEDYEELKRAFDLAWESKCYNRKTFDIYMLHMGDQDFIECTRAYFLSLNSNLDDDDITTDNIWILQNSKNKKYEVAYDSFRCIRYTSADATTYAYAIFVLGQMKNFEKAKELFEEATAKAEDGKFEMNEFIINNFMMAANNAGKFSEAIRAYRATTIRSANIEKSAAYAYKQKAGGRV